MLIVNGREGTCTSSRDAALWLCPLFEVIVVPSWTVSVDSFCVPVCLAIIRPAREAAGQRSVVLDVVVVRLLQAANSFTLRLKLAD